LPVFNYAKKEVNLKIVYYGPGLSGKTTNLQSIHDGIKPESKGKLVSLATQTDRTLFFDFMPMELGNFGGFKIRLHLYTVPGQVHYNATRKLVLKGVDGVVFVADSQKAMAEANIESFSNLEKNLLSYGKALEEIPHLIQANKRDLEDILSLEEISSRLNRHGALVTEAVASEGTGVMETLSEIIRMVMRSLRDQLARQRGEEPAAEVKDRRESPPKAPVPASKPEAEQKVGIRPGLESKSGIEEGRGPEPLPIVEEEPESVKSLETEPGPAEPAEPEPDFEALTEELEPEPEEELLLLGEEESGEEVLPGQPVDDGNSVGEVQAEGVEAKRGSVADHLYPDSEMSGPEKREEILSAGGSEAEGPGEPVRLTVNVPGAGLVEFTVAIQARLVSKDRDDMEKGPPKRVAPPRGNPSDLSIPKPAGAGKGKTLPNDERAAGGGGTHHTNDNSGYIPPQRPVDMFTPDQPSPRTPEPRKKGFIDKLLGKK